MTIDLSNIDISQLNAEELAAIDEYLELEQASPSAAYWLGGMSYAQREFHEAPKRNRLWRAANKTGKTSALNNECWGFLMGTHPYNNHHNVPTPCTVLYVVADLDASYANDVCENLHEFEPQGALDSACTYNEIKGYMVHGKRGILLKNGSKVIFRSGKQDGMALEGIKSHVVIINEPPEKSKWGGAMRSASFYNAPILVGFTPVGKPLDWLQEIIEENPKSSPLWDQIVTKLTYRAVPWLSKEFIDNQIANVPSWEYDQRVLAKWTGAVSDRYYEGFTPECVSDEAPDDDVFIFIGIDHGERPGNEGAVLVAVWKNKVTGEVMAYIFDEYVSPGRTSPEMDARNIDKILEKRGISLFEVAEATGDVNTAGKSAMGVSVNSIMEREFASLAMSSQPPFRIKKIRKKPGSINTGLKIINAAFVNGKLKIHPRCKELIKCLNQWRGSKTGEDGDFTHLLDAMRYVLAEKLDESRNKKVAPIMVR